MATHPSINARIWIEPPGALDDSQMIIAADRLRDGKKDWLRGKYICVELAGRKRERYRISQNTDTTISFVPLRWRDRAYLLSCDLWRWVKARFSFTT